MAPGPGQLRGGGARQQAAREVSRLAFMIRCYVPLKILDSASTFELEYNFVHLTPHVTYHVDYYDMNKLF